jgi:hypothetical protein
MRMISFLRDIRGNAVVETALLLPVYALVLVGALAGAAEGLVLQELWQEARFRVFQEGGGDAAGAPVEAGEGASVAMLPVTGGPSLAEEGFVSFSGGGSRESSDDRDEETFAPKELSDEMIRISWRAGTFFDFTQGEMDAQTRQNLTPKGVYLYDSDAFDDVSLLASELDGWFHRRSVELRARPDVSAYLPWGLDIPELQVKLSTAVRGERERADRSRHGYHRPIEDLVSDLALFVENFEDYEDAGFNTAPVGGYPDFSGGEKFWVPN